MFVISMMSMHNIKSQQKEVEGIFVNLRVFHLVFSLFLIFISFGVFCCEDSPETNHDDKNDYGVTPQESFEEIIPNLMSKWSIPGGAVALVKDERLILAEGYGLADKEYNEIVVANSLFRIASVSKPITAVAVLKLYEDGLLSLDEKAFSILNDLEPPIGATVDDRIYEITIRDLLQHSGGWDRELSFDPMFMSREIAKAMGVQSPADTETIIRYMMGQPLDFSPGERYAYSNFGYCVLGRVIERVTGQSYEDFVIKNVLELMGITSMSIGHTLLEERVNGEVRYYDYPGAPLVQSVFPDIGESVSRPYGGFYLEAMDAHGGWIASVVDLMRFITAVDGHDVRPDFLQTSTLELMVSRPGLSNWENSDWYYALGWQIRPTGDDANWWHTGSLPGTVSIIVRSYHGLAWTALFNSRPFNQSTFIGELDNALWQAVNNITNWPSHDLFENYPALHLYARNKDFMEIREFERLEIEKRVMEEIPMLMERARISPHQVNGEMRGFKITKLPENSILLELGIYRNDIIEEINNIQINDFETLLSLLSKLRSENRFEVAIKRNGRLIHLLYILK
jgi:CubicO group peptidase (beta-lactamase class C family)